MFNFHLRSDHKSSEHRKWTERAFPKISTSQECLLFGHDSISNKMISSEASRCGCGRPRHSERCSSSNSDTEWSQPPQDETQLLCLSPVMFLFCLRDGERRTIFFFHNCMCSSIISPIRSRFLYANRTIYFISRIAANEKRCTDVSVNRRRNIECPNLVASTHCIWVGFFSSVLHVEQTASVHVEKIAEKQVNNVICSDARCISQ